MFVPVRPCQIYLKFYQGPLLFSIYINDIQKGIKRFMLLFADDLKLVVNANLPNVTQNDLDIDWQKKWLLSFNTSDKNAKF